MLSELLTDELASERCAAVLSEIDLMINKIEVEEGNDNSSSKGGRKEDKEILQSLKRLIVILCISLFISDSTPLPSQ